ncbi:hypothetical protein NEOLEDRAFT_1173900 [Neolentinus lepideus HHB14362 ss-1]|uniref:Uncharacterized protein n=1 Tax=Neolentinus lepideus HHB14362 ss-1 TaxID=1314782 RepID=A0A165W0I6_9AGAM|nr:hypothetical protein NEOLEDRAFT_1173900 [Neolentinus lepideus HHB14362 ss-1]
MSGARPHASASMSFSGLPSASADRPLKRRITSMTGLPLFTSAATSFEPKPFSPNHASNAKAVASVRIPNAVPPPMDPSPNDPNAVFIRPPFKTFPNSHLYPEGLTYNLMAVNPEWFLEPTDFLSEKNTSPNAILYPSELEPPRGWCPALKKELRERGANSWPEGEEPRLRCTFCRRTYAGVNAKSMWRRHVYEKHKIAMANRRENAERGRGRTSTKDTKSKSDKKSSVDKENVTFVKNPTFIASTASNKYAWPSPPRKAGPSVARAGTYSDSSDDEDTPADASVDGVAALDNELLQSPLGTGQHLVQPETPPLTPRKSLNPTVGLSPYEKIELSPYDPLAEPSFRHSPGTVPSAQPWKFNSPSHPLYGKAGDVSLNTATHVSLTFDSSPPCPASLTEKEVTGLSTPEYERLRSEILQSPVKCIKPSPRRLFTMGTMSDPASKPVGFSDVQDLFPDEHLLDAPFGSEWLTSEDPILSMSIYQPLPLKESFEVHTPPLSSPEVESPVLRSTSVLDLNAETGSNASLVGLGIGLLEPFSLDGESFEELLDIEEIYASAKKSKSKPSPKGSRSVPQELMTEPGDSEIVESTRASKRRRTSTA